MKVIVKRFSGLFVKLHTVQYLQNPFSSVTSSDLSLHQGLLRVLFGDLSHSLRGGFSHRSQNVG